MQKVIHDFIKRQYMITSDFELFHFLDYSTIEVEYHNHDFYEIFFFISGKVTYMIEGISYRLQPGDIVVINNKDLHKPIIDPCKPYERIVIWLNPNYLKQNSRKNTDLTLCFETASRQRHHLLRLSPESHSYIFSTLNRFEDACHSISFGNDVLKHTYLIELIVYLNRAIFELKENKLQIDDIESNEKINQIISYINDNLIEKLSLEILAKRFYISKYHLSREFKKYTGYTLYKYIQAKRLIFAKTLLQNGLNVTETCLKSGFSDYSNFIRTFKKEFKISPKKYALKMRKKHPL